MQHHNTVFFTLSCLSLPLVNANVFIPSGAGSPGFAGILECLRQEKDLKVFAGDAQTRAYGHSLADGFVQMPPSSSPEYVAAVIQKAKEQGCSVILPITTAELLPLSENIELLKQNGLAIAISQPQALEVANNKANLYKFLVGQYAPCPDFAVVKDKERFFVKLHLLGFPHRNVVMKPASGNGSRGFRIVCNAAEIQSEYFETKAGAVKTSLEALQSELPNDFDQEIVLCEYLPGTEYSVDILANNGQTLAIAIRSRDKVVSGISVRGTFAEDAEIENQCISIVSDLQLHGPIGFQFKRSAHDFPKILEINPRLQGAVSTALFAGINFPLMAVKLALGGVMDNGLLKAKTGVAFNRYWADIKE